MHTVCAWRRPLLSLLLTAACLISATAQSTQTGQLIALTVAHGKANKQIDGISYHLRPSNSDGSLYTLDFMGADLPKDLITGDTVEVTMGTPTGPAEPGVFYISSWRKLNPSTAKDGVYYDGFAPLDISSITWVVDDMCGMKNKVQAKAVRSVYHRDAGSAHINTSNGSTLQEYFQSCTYGAMQFTREKNVVYNLSIPCTGRRKTSVRFNSTLCGYNELFGWMEYAMNYSRTVFGIDPMQYKRRIMVLPPQTNCSDWDGRGTLGCDPFYGCDIWLNDLSATKLKNVMHEYGHTFGLRHAHKYGPPLVAFGDQSCVMGGPKGGMRCFNAPHSWKLGVASPLLTLDGSSFQIGLHVNVVLPSSTLDVDSMIRIVPTWVADPTAASMPFYINYREQILGDAGLTEEYVNDVIVYRLKGAAGELPSMDTRLMVSLPVNGTWVEPSGMNFNLKYVGRTQGSAGVTLCRFSDMHEVGEACEDGIDNDCDGLYDYDDPDCQ